MVRNRTLANKFHLLKSTTGMKQGRHLDIGAGTGAFVQYMNHHGWKARGLNRMKKPGRGRWNIIRQNYCRLSFETFSPKRFDAISLWHVLEHVHDLYPYLHRIKNILKPGGGFLLQFRIIPVTTQ